MSGAVAVRPLSSLDAMALAMVLGFLTLHDYYSGPFAQGIRPFDFAAVGLLAGLLLIETLCLPERRLRYSFAAPWSLLGIAMLVLLGLAAGVFFGPAGNPKVVIGVGMGLALFMLFSGLVVPAAWLERVLKWLIAIHAIALLLQALVYYSTGSVINYHVFLGAEPRVFGRFFRPSGMFLEPAQYGFFMLLVLALKLRLKARPDAFVWFGFASVFLTVSLYGVLAVSLLLFAYAWRSPVFLAALALVAIGLAANPRVLDEVEGAVFVVQRLSDLGGDVSAQQRYSGLANLQASPFSSPELLFGRGFSNDYERFGLSGIAFLVNGIGILGALLFLAFYAAMVTPGARMFALFILVLALAAASRWTGWLWWVWLGLYANRFPPVVLARDPVGLDLVGGDEADEAAYV